MSERVVVKVVFVLVYLPRDSRVLIEFINCLPFERVAAYMVILAAWSVVSAALEGGMAAEVKAKHPRRNSPGVSLLSR